MKNLEKMINELMIIFEEELVNCRIDDVDNN